MQNARVRTHLAKPISSLCVLAVTLGSLSPNLFAQRNRVNGSIDDTDRAALHGHVHPQALPEDDEGPLDPALPLSHVTLMLKKSDAQQKELDQLLEAQQNPASPNFHHWLTPEEYADRFGVSQDEVNQVVSWLQSQKLQVNAVGRGRNWVSFDGTVMQGETAVHTSIHKYLLKEQR